MKHAVVRLNACDSCHEYGMTWKTNSGVRLWVRGRARTITRDRIAAGPGATPPVTSARFVLPAAVRSTSTATAAAHGQGDNPGADRSHACTDHGQARRRAADRRTNHCPARPADHMPTTNSCQSCHTSIAWSPVRTVDHTQVIGSCVSCHNGKVARGKPSAHIASSNACETCHTTNAWMPARFDQHAASWLTPAPLVTTPCMQLACRAITCQPRSRCDRCHGTLAWLPAKLDHSSHPEQLRDLPQQHQCCRQARRPHGPAARLRDLPHVSGLELDRTFHARRRGLSGRSSRGVELRRLSHDQHGSGALPARLRMRAPARGCHAKDFKPARSPEDGERRELHGVPS